MADRYWVGGTANWDGTAGTKWATTSGGAGGAAVPTSADDVFFDANSGAVTVTVAATGTCANLNFTGFTGTFTGNSALQVSGSLTAVSGMTWTHGGTITFLATGTVISAGKTLGPVTVQGASTTTTLGDALNCNTLTVTSGTFTTNNFNVTATALSSNNSNTRTINLGSSTVTLNSAGIAAAISTGLTINSGTSNIVISAAGGNIIVGSSAGSGATFYNVSFTATGTATSQVAGVNTFNNFSVAAPSTAGVKQFWFNSPTTINGTLSTTGTAGNRRVWFQGVTYGIAQTLTINSAPSLTDADFRDIYVIGTAAPISGTRIGDLRGIRGITASTPKTVYWNLAAGGNWSANAWAATSGGAVSTDNFPLAQDTAVIENTGLNTSATITFDGAVDFIGTLNMSTRTNAMTFSDATYGPSFYGDLTLGSGVATTGATGIVFRGRNIQTITSAGKTLTLGTIEVNSYGGTVQLADALNIGTNALTVTNGTFDTKNFNVTAGSLSSSNSNVRTITLGSSTVTLSAATNNWSTGGITNLTFNAGTSTISLTNTSAATFAGGGLTFYNVTFSGTTATTHSLSGANTFNNLTITAPASAGLMVFSLAANQTINGTLTCAGATAVRRVFVRSDTLGTTRTLTVGTLSAQDCDFRDITIAGAAAGSSPTRAGDCGGNSGITFPAPKTVYWNLAGAQNWSATGWAPGSGGTPDINQFPLAQDTAVFDNTGSVGTVTVDAAWNIGTFDASLRTSAMTFTISSFNIFVYGDWKFGIGVTSSVGSGGLNFAKRGTQTITSNGVTFGRDIIVDCITGTVQLADALSLNSARTLTLNSGTFDAVSYNVTTGLFNSNSTPDRTLKMGSGTWTLSGTGAVWGQGVPSGLNFYKGTANIVLSDTSTTARTFAGGSLSYNKLTIGGTTGTSTLTISGNNQFTELASTKTVAHTIALGTTSQTFGKWTVTGTVGNVVTVTGTATITIAGARVTGVDYLALGTTGISATSPGEFYAGANSTGGTNAILTAAPAAVTRYWRGGTGTWDATTTTNWSASSGGAGGASVPTSADAVVFDSASNATAYTVTCTATQLRCASLTMAGPASGNVTWAGTAPLAIHGNVTLPATGLTRTYTGAITLSSNSTGRTFTTNGVTLASNITVNGVDSSWSLGSALDNGLSTVTITNGSFALSTYNLTCGNLSSNNANKRTVDFGSSTLTVQGDFNFGTTESNAADLTITAGTSQVNLTANPTFSGNGKTFYNVAFTSTSASAAYTINGANSFNNLSFTGITAAGLKNISLSANQTVTGTLTLSAGTNATMRHFVQSDTIGTTRTLTCAAVASLTDIDFRDITIAGAAAPVSGTRLGDCKGNSGITFTAAANKYWNLAAGGNWGGAIGWATGSGGTPAINNFPLAQDTCFFESTGLNSGATVTINANYNIGTIDMSARTSNTMTLATGTTTPTIYGNWINGTGITLTGTNVITFAGRGSQTITSAGKTFTQSFTIDTPGGSVTLQDAFVGDRAQPYTLTSGTFDANGFNFTLTGSTGTSRFDCSNSNVRTLAIGSGTWTIAGPQGFTAATSTNLTVTGTGTISLTSASAKTFAGGGVAYTNITLNQGGAGTLTITGNNTFKNITNSYSATGATTIALGTTTQTLTNPWTATGTATRVLTVQGTSASSPGTLIFTGAGTGANVDYLAITGVRAYSLATTWYAGANSTNNGSLGWYFEAAPVPATAGGNFFFMFYP